MGKRKHKVRWSSVDGISWSNGEQDENSTDVSSGIRKVEGGEGNVRRSSAPSWTNSVAPRFERKAAEQKHIYYEGEICEAEDLPNGFTKIRSKNLDILFKRDYYEQRLAVQQQISEQLLKVKTSEVDQESADSAPENTETTITPGVNLNNEIVDNTPEPDSLDKSCPWTFDKIDPNDIPEFKPSDTAMDAGEVESGHTSPFYVNHLPQDYEPHPQPNLYLYTPSNNTLIPCEEIIIPNPGMSPDGPVYSGPTNIYLAYPVQGPDGRGYITQPFTPPGSYMSQDSGSYQYEGTNSYSSTPHTHYSGEDSGSSTQPTSPPPLDKCDPTSWTRDMHPHPSPPNIEGYYDPLPTHHPSNSSTDGPTKPSQSVPYIPGLALETSQPPQKKTQKRRKKKNKTESSVTSSESPNTDFESVKISPTDILIYNQTTDVENHIEAQIPPIHEIHLTDDLADSLVNPPIHSEGTDEHPNVYLSSQSQHDFDNESLKQTIFEKNDSMENVPALQLEDMDTTNTIELEDKEICDITNKIDAIKSATNVAGLNLSSENKFSTRVENECAQKNIDIDSVENIDVTKEKENSDERLHASPVQKTCDNSTTSMDESKNVENQTKSRNQQRRNKNSKKAQKINIITTDEVPKSKDDVSVTKASKMSYSSVTKSNIVKDPKPLLSIQSEPKIEQMHISKPLPTNPSCQDLQSKTEDDSDKWEKVPLSVSKQENWEKTSKKRKNKNKIIKFKESSPVADIPEKAKENTPPKEEATIIEEEAVMEEDNGKYEEAENEKKKQRRKKKKQSSEDPEEGNAGRRIVICDEQIEIENMRSIRRSSEAMNPLLLGNVKSSGFGDFLVVSELGLGISRGCMNYGRLYQGKYIPPDRTDGLLPECEEDNISAPEKGDKEEEIVDVSPSTVPTDIGLD